MLMKKMFSAESPAHSGQADILNPGSCVKARQSPSEGGRSSNMFKKMISIVAVAGLVLALAGSADAATMSADTDVADGTLPLAGQVSDGGSPTATYNFGTGALVMGDYDILNTTAATGTATKIIVGTLTSGSDGNIDFNTDGHTSYNREASLEIDASGNVNMGGFISTVTPGRGAAAITINADGFIDVDGGVTSRNTNGSASYTAGSIFLSGAAVTAGGVDAGSDGKSGTIDITATSGNVLVNGDVLTDARKNNSGAITVKALAEGGTITVTGNIDASHTQSARLCLKSHFVASCRYRWMNAILIIPTKFKAVFSKRENTRRLSFSQPINRSTMFRRRYCSRSNATGRRSRSSLAFEGITGRISRSNRYSSIQSAR